MKRKDKTINIVSLCVIITLIFLCTFNVVYSYFTATSSRQGDLLFSNLDVKFSYMLEGGSSPIVVADKEFAIIPNETMVSRGGTVTFKTQEGEKINYLNFTTSTDSCNCYVRFRVNAYKTDDETINYGQYFELNINNNFVSKKVLTVNGETNAIYYMNDSLQAGQNYTFTNQLLVSWSAPLELLHSSFSVSITFEAVQSANLAHKAVFNDGWGYLDSWS